MSKQQLYNYTKISELKEGDRNVNVYGIIKYFCPLKQTTTSDWNGIYTLVDHLVKDNNGNYEIRCNLFGTSKEKLPQVSCIGDIVRFNRMVIKSFRGRLQMQGSKHYSSWLVFYKEKNYMNPVSSHINFSITEIDQYHLDELKKISDYVVSKFCEYPVALLKDICIDNYYNFVVQVLAKFTFQDNPNHCILRVSDGTMVPYNSFHPKSEERKTDLMEATENHACSISLFDNHAYDALNVKAGDFVRLNNVHLKSVPKDLVEKSQNNQNFQMGNGKNWSEFILHSGNSFNRGVSLVSASDEHHVLKVKERLKVLIENYIEVQQRKKENEMISSDECVTETDTQLPVRSLSFIITDTNNYPNKYKLRGKLLSMKPKKFKEICTRVCQHCFRIAGGDLSQKCKHCQNDLKTIFYLEFLVEDESALLGVELAGDDAVYFLNGITPDQFLTNTNENLHLDVMKKFDKLLKMIENAKKMPAVVFPVIELCIYTFNHPGNEGFSYRVCNTRIA